ncbi:IS630 family transposase [Streptomyces sp. JW3]|uniref:IS630 family transposase n=1 Tax=Streptomyces sp. JW3 TaxID=3456955 RepID=UPI003FA41557
MRPRGKPVGVHQVLGHRPCDVGLSGQLWTRRLVGELIAKLYRVRLTEPGVGKYPKRWGLSFQRPDKRAVEQDPLAVRRWHEETWPKIRAKAKRDGGEILFADQVGIRSDQVTGRTWGVKGKTPVVRRSGNRSSVNAMSAISTKGRMHFMVFTESFTAEVMCRFLDRLAGHFGHKVHLVVDWLAAHPDDVELHFLPPYSPELNPDELVTQTSSTACPSSTGPATRPNSPPRPAAPSADDSASRTSSAATSAVRTSATSWPRTP